MKTTMVLFVRVLSIILFCIECVTGDEAAKFRNLGDGLFVQGKSEEALEMFNQAIKIEPENALNYYKRFRVHDRLRNRKMALLDLTKTIQFDPKHVQAYALRARSYMNHGDCKLGAQDYEKVLSLKPDHADALKLVNTLKQCAEMIEKAEVAIQQRQWAKANELLTEAMQITGGSSPYLKMLRAQARLEMGEYLECIADAGEVVKHEAENIEALLLRGRAYYYTAEHEMTLRHLREALKFDPEHTQAKKLFQQLKKLTSKHQAGIDHMAAQRFTEAKDSFIAALEVDPTHKEFNKKIYLSLCEAYLKLNDVDLATLNCDKALEIDGSLIEAYIMTADYYTKTAESTAEFESAVRAWHKALELDRNNHAAREGLQRAEAGLKQSKQKNYYKILGLRRDCETSEIKKAYRKLAIEFHPDRNVGKPESEIEKITVKFQEITEAYEVLSDPNLRGKYDRGEEVFENQGGGQQRHHGFPFHHFFHQRGGF